MERRSDYKTALLIDAAIHEAAATGHSAARDLALMGIPFETAMRVLTRPDERRHPTPPPVARTISAA